MKNTLFTIITVFFIGSCAYSQEVVRVKGKSYEGYIFPKEHSIWGFPPEIERYTPSPEDIAIAEKMLRDNINTDYVRSNQEAYRKPPINRRTLNKYMRQYVGYLTGNNEIVIQINLLHKKYFNENEEKERLSDDIIFVCDGGYYFWSIRINITTKELSDMRVNGIS